MSIKAAKYWYSLARLEIEVSFKFKISIGIYNHSITYNSDCAQCHGLLEERDCVFSQPAQVSEPFMPSALYQDLVGSLDPFRSFTAKDLSGSLKIAALCQPPLTVC